jgi:naringenin degradation protein FdeD
MTLPATAGHILCRLEDIEDGEGKGFSLRDNAADENSTVCDIFVVREGGRVFAYANICPHQGTPLDWTPDRFISADSGLILCATHGAQFTVADGTCVSGPCIGARLRPVPVTIDPHGRIALAKSSNF